MLALSLFSLSSSICFRLFSILLEVSGVPDVDVLELEGVEDEAEILGEEKDVEDREGEGEALLSNNLFIRFPNRPLFRFV